MLKIFKKKSATNLAGNWYVVLQEDGLLLSKTAQGHQLQHELIYEVIGQLNDATIGQWIDGSYFISWDELYALQVDPEMNEFVDFFELPNETTLTPSLISHGSLTDENFQIVLGTWVDPNGAPVQARTQGAIVNSNGQAEFLNPAQWELLKQVKNFGRRNATDRSDLKQRLAWGKIRKQAILANANLDSFLFATEVITPEKLEIGLRKSETITDDAVIEIIPSFPDAPEGWIERFDQSRTVLDRYDIPTKNGIVQVVIEPKVKTVLNEIKRMPGRMAAGTRAQAFLLNPFATLGDDATEVISEDQFISSRESAGLLFERFFPHIEKNPRVVDFQIGLRIEAPSLNGDPSSTLELMSNIELQEFLSTAKNSIKRGYQLIFWNGYELEINPDTETHLLQLESALNDRSNPLPVIRYEDVHDLSKYSGRIQEIGVEKPIVSAYIAKEGPDWFPENIIQFITYVPENSSEETSVLISRESVAIIKDAVKTAELNQEEKIRVSGIDRELPIQDARRIVESFENVWDEIDARTFKPKDHSYEEKGGKKPGKKTLVLHSNIESVGYREARNIALTTNIPEAEIPRSMSKQVSLLPHQVKGVAWMQHLFRLQSDHNVRGALLADDMGLGKTFQLLTLMAWIIERNPQSAPILIVAPISLLENWNDEADKFFPDTFKILTAYGDSLASLRLSKQEVDARLRSEDGLVKFLRPGWIGDSNVVLTTYETLRDLEFSFAGVYWSLMICDEAQKIKNPAAMVTRAAWRQNVGFRIPCTGTPVENTLVDIWSLFEFCQPGLLGALNDFGKLYRRPIEIDERDEAAKQRLEELRQLIEPQILRRTKQEVADLPDKIVVDDCRHLKISTMQRSLYAKALDDFKRREEPGFPSPFKNHLGLLQYIRVLCTDPRKFGHKGFKPDPLTKYRQEAPKLDWLLDQLNVIKTKQEKAIVFCEFRQIQCLLQHYIKEALGYEADIINGDTNASASHSASRQKRIKAFQNHPGFGVLILSPVAVGFGVNIQAANHVIHYMRTWNPAKEDQATDRSYRIGQTKPVYVYYPVVCGDDFTTFDERLDQLLDSKRSLAGDVLNGSPDISMADFSVEQVVPGEYKDIAVTHVTYELAMQLDWRLFEGLAASLWKAKGFSNVYCTPPSGDNGVDVVAISGDSGVLVQTKSSAVDGYKHGWDTVKELLGGKAFYEAKHPGVKFKLIGLTNQFFNTNAHQNAALNSVELLEQPQLEELLSNYTIQMIDVERFVWS